MRTSIGRTRGLVALLTASIFVLGGCAAPSSEGSAETRTATESPTVGGGDEAQHKHEPSSHPATTAAPADDEMRVTLLGTGSPVPSEERYGMATLVQAGGLNLVFDAGRGATTRMTQAGVSPGQIDGVFITHFHSDHVNGLGDLWLTGFVPAFGGREGSFDVYGPTGVDDLVAGLRQAHSDDIDVRVADGEVERDTTDIAAHEFTEEGVIFDQDGVTVTMFEVLHDPAGAIDPAMGFRVDYADRSVLISGDTVPHDNVVEHGTGVDLLIHEVAAFEDPDVLPQVSSHHTSPREAGEIFSAAAPRMAVYSHIVNGTSEEAPGIPEEELVNRTRENYDGPLTVGEDLMSFLVTDEEIDTHLP